MCLFIEEYGNGRAPWGLQARGLVGVRLPQSSCPHEPAVTLGPLNARMRRYLPGSVFSSRLLYFFLGSILRLFKPSSVWPGPQGCLQALPVQFLSPIPFVPAVSKSRTCLGLRLLHHGVFSGTASSTLFINQHSLICSASSRNF